MPSVDAVHFQTLPTWALPTARVQRMNDEQPSSTSPIRCPKSMHGCPACGPPVRPLPHLEPVLQACEVHGRQGGPGAALDHVLALEHARAQRLGEAERGVAQVALRGSRGVRWW